MTTFLLYTLAALLALAALSAVVMIPYMAALLVGAALRKLLNIKG